MSSVSNGLYFLTLPLVSVMSAVYRKIRHARYLYIKRNVEKVWGARYTLGARYLSKNTVLYILPINIVVSDQYTLYIGYCMEHNGDDEPHDYTRTAELHLSGLTGTAKHTDMKKIRIIGFFFENKLHWQFFLSSAVTIHSMYLRLNLSDTPDLQF